MKAPVPTSVWKPDTHLNVCVLFYFCPQIDFPYPIFPAANFWKMKELDKNYVKCTVLNT